MATNDFLVFGGGSSPNVIDQATYAALAARLSGFQSGTALSAQLNKVWRQSSIMAAVLAQFTANYSGQNSVDDGTTATLLSNFVVALNAAGITAAQFDSTTKQVTTAFVQGALGNFRNQIGLSAATTLNANAWGNAYTLFGGSPYNVTLPPLSSGINGAAIRFSNIGSTAYTLVGAGSDTIFNGTTSNTLVLNPGDTVTLVSSGVWVMFGGSMSLLASGAMTGPGWRTQPQFDNSTRLATTAFVKQAGESFSSIQGIATTASLNSGHVGAFIWAYGAGITLTLPPVAGVPNGATITIGTPIGMTVKGNASETINNQFGVTSNTLALNAGEQAQFVSNGGAWYLASYTTVLGTTPAAGDNSTKLATTAFVQTALYSGKGIARFVSSGTFTVPAGVTTLYVSGCAAGGGGGAGAGNNDGQSSLVGGGGGGGGGAGQSVIRQAFAVTPGAAITVTIGAAGAAGTGGVVGAGGAGGMGGNTTLTGGVSLTLTGGAGGSGGAAVVSNAVGQGGGGGGGGSGYPNGSAGGDGNYAGLGGAGASSPFGGGGGSGRAATNTSAYQAGSAAGGFGAGGGGGGAGYGQASTAVTGGAGAVGTAGLIIFEW
ncbi:glycine-rich domain-containing protein [Burkholderia cenocepacia]|uniref:glycine-rich domain-containing protein n=1 Tax=Burkholderia cenocepacia TaxID=95486 RepID=UPI002ABD1749|nr:hypothetical protein [Burkholderia cenocepacia]